MARYLHSINIASVTGQKYLYYFKKRANALESSHLNALNHFYKGYIGKSIKSGQFINTKIVDTASKMVGYLSSFSEKQWLGVQSNVYTANLNVGRDAFNHRVKSTQSKINIQQQPQYIANYSFVLGSLLTTTPYLNYLFQPNEGFGIADAVLVNFANSATANINLAEDRTRCTSFSFTNYAIEQKNGDNNLYTGNINIELYENYNVLVNLKAYLTSRYPKTAISPTVISNGAAISGAIGRFFCCTIISDMPEPDTNKDYLEGAGLSELFCGYINKQGQFASYKISVEDNNYFFSELWQDNKDKWLEASYGKPPADKDNGQWLGRLPNILFEPIPIMLQQSLVLYVAGVKGHYAEIEQEDQTTATIKVQSAVSKITFNYSESSQAITYAGQQIIEHDASGSPDNYQQLGGTDKDYWNIYHTLWGGKVGNSSVVLVNVTRHKRFNNSSSNFMGSSIIDPQSDIETLIHIYIDDQIVEFSCQDQGFYPDIKSTIPTLFNENIFSERYPDTRSPLISKKFASVISDQEVLFCFTSYPTADKRLLVKFNITDRSFKLIREDPAASGQAVATCYQQQVKDNNGKELTPACIIYRIGIQGTANGKIYLSKDTGETWQEIADSPYTGGGGMYYLGNEYFTINYGKGFD